MKRTVTLLAAALIIGGCAQPSGPVLEPLAPLPAAPSGSQGAPAAAFPGKVAYIRDGALWLAVSGEEPQKLTSGPASRPVWSPDGRALAYVTTRPLGLGLWQSGAPLQEWTFDPAPEDPPLSVVEQVQWSPNSQHLALVLRQEGAGSAREVWLLSEPGGLTKLALPAGQQPDPFSPLDIAWRPDSRALTVALVDRQAMAAQLADLPIDGGPPALLLTESAQAQGAGVYRMPRWSPDGKRLAFWQAQPSPSLSADGVRLMVLDREAQEPAALGDMLPHPDWLAWSPDGARLAFVEGSGRDGGTGKQVAIWNGEGKALVEGGSVLDPAWLPDGSGLWVAYQSHPGVPRRIWKVDPAGRRLDRCPAAEGNPGRHDYRPMPTPDGGLLFIAVVENQPALLYADRRCESIAVRVVEPFDLPAAFYGHVPWDEVIAWHP